MRDRCYVVLGFLLGALALTCCARPAPSIATNVLGLVSTGMSDAEVVQLLGPPVMVSEQPRTLATVQTPNGAEFRDKRRYTYYYPGPAQGMDMLITFEDGVVVDKRQGRR